MTSRILLRAVFVLDLVVLSCLPVVSKASADASCNELLSELSNWLGSPPNEVLVNHVTNYQTDANSWLGWTEFVLSKSPNGNLVGVGEGNRLISTISINLRSDGPLGGPMQPFSIGEPGPISYEIDLHAGTVIFGGQYGPYDMICLGNKFAIVNTSDSLETFTFFKYSAPH
jgi:hypothetical protein